MYCTLVYGSGLAASKQILSIDGRADGLPWQARRRSYFIEEARLLRQKTENRYLTVLVASWGVNSCRKALFGVISRPDTPSAVFAGETVELW